MRNKNKQKVELMETTRGNVIVKIPRDSLQRMHDLDLDEARKTYERLINDENPQFCE